MFLKIIDILEKKIILWNQDSYNWFFNKLLFKHIMKFIFSKKDNFTKFNQAIYIIKNWDQEINPIYNNEIFDSFDIDGNTVLHKTISYIKPSTLKASIFFLKKYINKQNKQGKTILHILLSDQSSKDIDKKLDILMRECPDINLFDKDGFTPLHYAINIKDINIIEKLLSHKPNILIDTSFQTPIRYAIEQSDTASIKAILDYINKHRMEFYKNIIDSGLKIMIFNKISNIVSQISNQGNLTFKTQEIIDSISTNYTYQDYNCFQEYNKNIIELLLLFGGVALFSIIAFVEMIKLFDENDNQNIRDLSFTAEIYDELLGNSNDSIID